jgi:transcriptional antiterminator RfaH
MAYWACARLESRREAVAQHFLKLAGYEVYIPQVREQRLRRRRRVEVVSPLFPAYGFIVIEQQWHSARWSIGVTAIIMDGVAPARVPDLVVADIRAREVRGAVELPKLPEAPPGIKVGERVRVLGGPFQGHFGLYAGMKPHERVEVLLALFSGQQRVTLPRGGIELAPDASGP